MEKRKPGRPKKIPVEEQTTKPVQEAVPKVALIAPTKSPEERKLDYFQYSGDANSYEWEKENPLQVPKTIRERYPNLTFRWRAIDTKTGKLWRGKDYHGWQVFTDSKNPEGVKYGGDSVLAAMPNERAESYRLYVQNQSTDLVKSTQENQIEAMDRAASALRAKGVPYSSGEAGQQFSSSDGRTAKYPTGITIRASRTRNKRTGEVREQYRGYHPEEITEMTAKAQEGRQRNKTYSIPGVNPGS